MLLTPASSVMNHLPLASMTQTLLSHLLFLWLVLLRFPLVLLFLSPPQLKGCDSGCSALKPFPFSLHPLPGSASIHIGLSCHGVDACLCLLPRTLTREKLPPDRSGDVRGNQGTPSTLRPCRCTPCTYMTLRVSLPECLCPRHSVVLTLNSIS